MVAVKRDVRGDLLLFCWLAPVSCLTWWALAGYLI